MSRDDLRSWMKRHRVASFFLLAYALTWLAWLPTVVGYGGDLNQVLSLIAQFGPAVAALVVTWYSGASVRGWARSIVRWRVAPWWYVVAVGLPIVLIAVEGAIFGLLGNPINPSLVPGSLAAYIPTLAFLTLIAGLGEEPGWRGFALPRLETWYAPAAATLLLGLLWALWHLPLVLVDPRFPHGFTSLAPLVLLALLTLVASSSWRFSILGSTTARAASCCACSCTGATIPRPGPFRHPSRFSRERCT